MILSLVILAGITKRAQIPFSAWLPAAMAAPTPVSALVHSSTLVTAGVYLLIRFSHLLGERSFLFYTGVFTMFMSGMGANFENDLKKIIALSTLSQLGLIIIILSLGYPELSFFHLLTHALFKSLLFLCAGVFIHSMGDVQDIRHLGGASVACPVTSFYFIAASLALCGFPFLAGFYSKDLILELYFIVGTNSFMFVVVLLSTVFTLTYSVRLVCFIFLKNLGVGSLISVAEEGGIVLPMRLLFIFSIVAGCFMSWFYFPFTFVYLPLVIKILVSVRLLLAAALVYSCIRVKRLFTVVFTGRSLYFVGSMWLLPYISTLVFMPLVKIGEKLLKFFDQGWLEQLGGQGFYKKASSYSSVLDYSITLGVKTYLLTFLFLFTGCFYLLYLSSL